MIQKAIPSLLTVCNLALGVVALLWVSAGRASDAALMVVVGMVLDGLDGRAARFFHAESQFGKELDSLSDIVTFGVAPTLIMWHVVLHTLGWPGVLIAVLFPVCGALRLARFNIAKKSTNYFVGLPITAAGGILATLALYRDLLSPANVILPAGMVILALLMVSRTRYPNFKKIAFPRSAIVVVPLLAIGVYIIFRFQHAVVNRLIFVPLALYGVYGIGRMVRHRRRSRIRNREGEIEIVKPEIK
ncbi:CDP-diacylglycerol--serine O-phosphatidyltransferase [Alicyclobacillus cycloheptanicus]|uniref:CDP-diacylglycerol--serine O-phosphatidyltransferase n=1 Tax=Alicyclobacillus cycloheptanicus TaxID=1457 RepID=A0ABT9XJC3_9BACL|nr:CDP-diacylglycerol--serine O-phosphatidyltransferase [Alicyclobacillus cycloheptanicus]MDQ0190378.1 CDP-diacylglycerol--serine O-phosphatidyltransferase [Alicyclobacillus cycloheptanicus]WDM02621.1 CDP-diacylglycerol--serine O-phosphatidyltransferase [Alicyclobacillus cycloheptanicus]